MQVNWNDEMALIPAEIIKKKRDKKTLSKEDIQFFISSYTSGALPDYQMSALLMAILLNGMTAEETFFLTETMLHSGEVLNFSDIEGYKVDKHSTGGVGDKTSIILAPIVAAAGLRVPMISGRGLGHTGGTLDKLESIPGFDTQKDLNDFRRLLTFHNVGLIGQTREICPADKKIYALRDVTGTVESIPLICASIMSKKLAEGIDGLVLDVKFGSGAFMKTREDAESLALKLKDIGERGDKRVVAFLTNMEQPLGRMIGNALEIEECLSVLRQDSRAHLYQDCEELSVYLAGAMLWIGGLESTLENGIMTAQSVLESGLAYDKFEEICRAQGADLSRLPKASLRKDVLSTQSGYVVGFDCEGLGYASLMLGAGRLKSTDTIDPIAGIECHKKIGEPVKKGDVLFSLYSSDEELFAASEARVRSSIQIGPQKPALAPLVYKILS